MNKIHKYIALLLFSTLTFATAGKENDAVYKDKLIGTWIQVLKENGASMKATLTYTKEGVLDIDAVVEIDGKKIPMIASATWKIENGFLIVAITKTSNPQFVPRGLISKEPIIEITEKVFKYKTSSGEISTQTKVIKSS